MGLRGDSLRLNGHWDPEIDKFDEQWYEFVRTWASRTLFNPMCRASEHFFIIYPCDGGSKYMEINYCPQEFKIGRGKEDFDAMKTRRFVALFGVYFAFLIGFLCQGAFVPVPETTENASLSVQSAKTQHVVGSPALDVATKADHDLKVLDDEHAGDDDGDDDVDDDENSEDLSAPDDLRRTISNMISSIERRLREHDMAKMWESARNLEGRLHIDHLRDHPLSLHIRREGLLPHLHRNLWGRPSQPAIELKYHEKDGVVFARLNQIPPVTEGSVVNVDAKIEDGHLLVSTTMRKDHGETSTHASYSLPHNIDEDGETHTTIQSDGRIAIRMKILEAPIPTPPLEDEFDAAETIPHAERHAQATALAPEESINGGITSFVTKGMHEVYHSIKVILGVTLIIGACLIVAFELSLARTINNKTGSKCPQL